MSNTTNTINDLGSVILKSGEFRDELLTFTSAATVVEGTILARDSLTLKMVPYVKGGVVNGNGIPKAILTRDVSAKVAGDLPIRSMTSGSVRTERLIIDADGDDSNIDPLVLVAIMNNSLICIDVDPLSYVPSGGIPPSPPATPRVMAGRHTVVAGSAVHFNFGETDYDLFRGNLYVWDYGDINSGTWAQTGRNKNNDYSPIGGHVFDTAGVYTIKCTVIDQSGIIGVYSDIVTVDNPDVVYAGANTICFSTGSDFTGAPSGSLSVTTSNIKDIETHIATGKRILLRCGDTWSGTSDSLRHTYSNINDVYIGHFGLGTSPDSLGIFSNAPQINITGTASAAGGMFNFFNSSRWIFNNIRSAIDVDGSGLISGTEQTIADHTMRRLSITGAVEPITFGHWNTTGHVGLAIVECDISDGYEYNVYIGSEQLMFMGNKFRNSKTSHNSRVWQGYLAFIAHNYIAGSSVDTANGRHLLKLHGPSESKIGDTGVGDLLRYRTQFASVCNNVFGAGGPWPVAIGPTDGNQDERLTGVVFNANIWAADGGQNSTQLAQRGVKLWASRSKLSNNVFDAHDSHPNDLIGIEVEKRGIEPPPTNNWIYQNTLYADTTLLYPNVLDFIRVSSDAVDTLVVNNLVNTPTSATGTVNIVADFGTNTTDIDNIQIANSDFISPENIDYSDRSFKLIAESPAISGGSPVPVYRDIELTVRSLSNPSIGAYEN